jgi:hypothetical protein
MNEMKGVAAAAVVVVVVVVVVVLNNFITIFITHTGKVNKTIDVI